jgi:hypothetical protein
MAEAALSVYGLMAEFETAEELLPAARRAYEQGYRRLDAYSPHPVEGLADAIGRGGRTALPTLVLCAGMLGGLAGFALAYYVSVIAYPINIGGRPLNSWPAFIPVVFETTVLASAVTTVLGMILLNGLPQPHHPVFNVQRFATLASRDRYFLCIEAADPQFSAENTRRFLESMKPSEISEVPL